MPDRGYIASGERRRILRPMTLPRPSTNWPTRYRDARGDLATTIHSDGSRLSMNLRGIAFSGWMLDDFEPEAGSDPVALASFTLAGGSLCDCVLEVEIPVPVPEASGFGTARLEVSLRLGPARPDGGVDARVPGYRG